jgi:hypothetical protein
MSALHDWRTLPLMSIVHEPHTSSRHTHSQTTGGTVAPSTVFGAFCTSMSALITFICG